jgi:hypothetical protein
MELLLTMEAEVEREPKMQGQEGERLQQLEEETVGII